MAGAFALRIALPGLTSMTVALNRMRTDIADWTPFWKNTFAPAFYRHTLEDFVLEGGRSGASWKPLSPAYAAWKAKRFPGNGLLVRTGALKASLLSADAPQAIFRPSATGLEIGSSVPYALYHQTGTGRMPQRPPLRVDAAFMAAIGKALQVYVQNVWVQRRAEAMAAPSADAFGVSGAA